MEKTNLVSRKVNKPSETLRKMKPGARVTIKTRYVKTSNLRVIASKLKQEGYLFRVSDKGLTNKTIVECLKIPTL